ncbi:unnamed protein product [Effrenium voratum]|uniref:MAM domain-containing protein n=1 Tax=Effrenium voratum TaxID=2562239 RepID=A0AA36NAP3_9DINO|nr:unnamed protein product [Effrenium voratum]
MRALAWICCLYAASASGDCNFETDLCGWSSAQWVRHRGSSHGASEAFEGSWYALLDSSYHKSMTSYLASPFFTEVAHRVTFYYYMHGVDVDTLTFESYLPESGWQTLWSLEGSQEDSWTYAAVPLPDGSQRVRFGATTKDGWDGDFAIDGVTIVVKTSTTTQTRSATMTTSRTTSSTTQSSTQTTLTVTETQTSTTTMLQEQAWSPATVSAGASPPARAHHVAAWDPKTRALLVLSGNLWPSPAVFDDFWSFDWEAKDWTNLGKAPLLAGASGVWDTRTDSLLLFGVGNESEVWRYSTEAKGWSLANSSGPQLESHSAVWDETRASMLVFAGQDGELNGTVTNKLWQFEKDVAHLEIEIGPSAFGVKCVDTEYEELLCGLDAGNPSKRVTHRLYANADDEFKVSTVNTQVCAERLDRFAGWALDLAVSCTATKLEVLRQLTIEIGASSYRTQCVDGRNLSLACSPDAGDKGKRDPDRYLADANDTFEIKVIGSWVCANRLDESAGWEQDLAITCSETREVPEAVEVRIGSSEAFSKCVVTDYYAITCEEDGGNKGRRGTQRADVDAADLFEIVVNGSTVCASHLDNSSWTVDLAIKCATHLEVWHQVSLGANATSPPARSGHAAVWDPLHKAMLVFGGTDGRWLLSDFWRFNTEGESWEQLPYGPSARQGHTAIWDPATEIMYIFGGVDATGHRGDLWLYRQQEMMWMQMPVAGPAPRSEHSAVWDPEGRGMLVFGGWNSYAYFRDVWHYQAKELSTTTTITVSTSSTTHTHTSTSSTQSTKTTSSTSTTTTSERVPVVAVPPCRFVGNLFSSEALIGIRHNAWRDATSVLFFIAIGLIAIGIICATARDFLSWKRYAGTSKLQGGDEDSFDSGMLCKPNSTMLVVASLTKKAQSVETGIVPEDMRAVIQLSAEGLAKVTMVDDTASRMASEVAKGRDLMEQANDVAERFVQSGGAAFWRRWAWLFSALNPLMNVRRFSFRISHEARAVLLACRLLAAAAIIVAFYQASSLLRDLPEHCAEDIESRTVFQMILFSLLAALLCTLIAVLLLMIRRYPERGTSAKVRRRRAVMSLSLRFFWMMFGILIGICFYVCLAFFANASKKDSADWVITWFLAAAMVLLIGPAVGALLLDFLVMFALRRDPDLAKAVKDVEDVDDLDDVPVEPLESELPTSQAPADTSPQLLPDAMPWINMTSEDVSPVSPASPGSIAYLRESDIKGVTSEGRRSRGDRDADEIYLELDQAEAAVCTTCQFGSQPEVMKAKPTSRQDWTRASIHRRDNSKLPRAQVIGSGR